MTGSVDLSPAHRATVERILAEHVPECEVRAFGSRVTWTSRDPSDLDLAIVGKGPLDLRTLSRLNEAFEESILPMRVDVLDWHSISDNFREVIEQDYVVLQMSNASQDADQPSIWREVLLEDVCEFRSGSVFKLKYQGQSSGDFPFIKVSDMNLESNIIRILDSNNWVSQATAQEIRARPLPSGATVFAKIGEALRQNRLRMLVRPTIVDNNMMGAIPKGDIVDSKFLYYGMHSIDFGEVAAGTALPYLTLSALKSLPFQLPPLAEQRAIAHILGTLDDKIELNRRMNQTLEEMARALFKSWFVNFDPVRAKAALRHDATSDADLTMSSASSAERWTIQRARSYLDAIDPQMVDLFPDRLVPSELGEIPEGWEPKALGDMADISSGKRPARRVSVADGEMQTPLWGGNGPMGFVAEALVDFPIVLTGRVGTLGSVFRITTPCWPSDNTLIMRANSAELFNFLFLHISTIDFGSLNRGSTQPLLTQGDLKSQRAVTPTGYALDRFSELTADLFDKIDIGRRQSQSLRLIRDCLLPWLLSGETQVGSIG